jgi:hypothetical protein
VQAQTISTIPLGSAVTTGIVGVTSTQTARLNVLNLQPVISGVTASVCPATLEFYDDAGTLLKQFAAANIAPATTAWLAFKPPVPATAVNARAQIRAVVLTPPTYLMNPSAGSMSPTVIPVSIGCQLMTSLEIIDDSTGVTRILTTDLRAMPAYRILPPMPAVQ